MSDIFDEVDRQLKRNARPRAFPLFQTVFAIIILLFVFAILAFVFWALWTIGFAIFHPTQTAQFLGSIAGAAAKAFNSASK